MIQKGLFGNLEEKFRSLNVSVDDDFFKSLSLKPKTQSTPEKGFIKATNFTTILNNNNSSLPKVSLDQTNKIDIDFSKIKLPDYEPQPSTSKSGNFLEKTTENDTGPPPEISQHVSNTKSNGKLKNKSKKNLPKSETGIKNDRKFDDDRQKNETEENNDRKFDDDRQKNETEENVLKNEEVVLNCDNVVLENEIAPKFEETSSERDEIATKSEEIAPADEIASKCEETVSRSEEFISENDIDSKNCELANVEDTVEEEVVLLTNTDHTTIPDDVEDHIEAPNKEDLNTQNEDLLSRVEESDSNSIITEDAIQINEELKTEDSTSEIPQLSKDNDNNLDQKLSDELQLRPINGYILQTTNPSTKTMTITWTKNYLMNYN
ncbi:hypothetical protein QE152_g23297 [Popillia japonica]|uniref:Uncharacterized protein n=1 Tax=Popillia japonica TaxID=7064 RepID=A0AAW1KI00_POPJA